MNLWKFCCELVVDTRDPLYDIIGSDGRHSATWVLSQMTEPVYVVSCFVFSIFAVMALLAVFILVALECLPERWIKWK